MHRRPSLTAAAGLVLIATAAAAPVQAQPASEPQAIWDAGQAAHLAWNGRQRGWTTTSSGLQYKVIKRAKSKTAPQPKPGCTVTINYEGKLITGGVFDSSYQRGEPATFPLSRLIKGWQEGVPLMKVGKTYDFLIPADLAYGARYRKVDAPDKVSIPSNSALRFKIELLALGEDCQA